MSGEERGEWLLNGRTFRLIKKLGNGTYGSVFEVQERAGRPTYALKIIAAKNSDCSSDDIWKNCNREISILDQLSDCSKVMQLVDYQMFYIAQGKSYAFEKAYVLMQKGEANFLEVLDDRSHQRSDEAESVFEVHPQEAADEDEINIRFYLKKILNAVSSIHCRSILHADLKPANFVTFKGNVKLIDFGFAEKLEPGNDVLIRTKNMGTLGYMAPEIYHGKRSSTGQKYFEYTTKVDIWAIGCIIFQLVYRCVPYKLYGKGIFEEKFCIPLPGIEDENLVDLIRSCLRWDPISRVSVFELLSHDYLKRTRQICDSVLEKVFSRHNTRSSLDLLPSVIENMTMAEIQGADNSNSREEATTANILEMLDLGRSDLNQTPLETNSEDVFQEMLEAADEFEDENVIKSLTQDDFITYTLKLPACLDPDRIKSLIQEMEERLTTDNHGNQTG